MARDLDRHRKGEAGVGVTGEEGLFPTGGARFEGIGRHTVGARGLTEVLT